MSIYLSNLELYETKTRLYAIGKDGSFDRYRVLKFDRTLTPPSQLCFENTLSTIPKDELGLYIDDDGIFYTRSQILALLKMLEEGNGSIHSICKGFGLLGVTRFLEGYYLVAITQATRLVNLGPHAIMRVDEAKMIPIANPALVKISRKPEEQLWIESFQTLVSQHDFYFSYTYDLTKPLQLNLFKMCESPCSYCMPVNPHLLQSSMYTFNWFLIQLAMAPGPVDRAWFVPVIQGYIGQIQIDVCASRIHVTLIARRSRKFAGVRFLRRGLDAEGYVANELESEQIVSYPTFQFSNHCSIHERTRSPGHCVCCNGQGTLQDGTSRVPFSSDLKFPKEPCFTSFVQHRGSIPLLWSQENRAMTPKPPITLNIRDPFFVGASLHFNRMLEHYDPPIIVLNLIKTKEKFKREAILGEEFETAIEYLNQFLPLQEKIEYHHVDMSYHAKTGSVMDILEAHVEKMVDRVGFFATCPEPISHAKARHDGTFITRRRQSGVIRTNCIDCLDRTNAAAFVIGKSALARQLLHMGVLTTSHIDFDSEAVSLLMNLYQAHGDAIAFQYAGSNLVNTMSTYRKGDFVSQSRDLLETIKRYYSSSFTDTEKQDTIDIFLGLGKNNYKPTLFKAMSAFTYTNWRRRSEPLSSASALSMAIPKESLPSLTFEYEPLSSLLRKRKVEFVQNGSQYLMKCRCNKQPIINSTLTWLEMELLWNLCSIYYPYPCCFSHECPTSQTDSPFATHTRPENTVFALGGLKKWISSDPHDGPSNAQKKDASSTDHPKSTDFSSQKKSINGDLKTPRKSNAVEEAGTSSQASFLTSNYAHFNVFCPVVPKIEIAEYDRYLHQFQFDHFLQHIAQRAHEHPDFWVFKKAISLDAPKVPLESQKLYQEYLEFPESCLDSFVPSISELTFSHETDRRMKSDVSRGNVMPKDNGK